MSNDLLIAASEAGLACGLDEPDPRAVRRLREWRYATHRDTQLPTYVIMPNALLYEIARVMPRNAEELGVVKGMGATRLERYGGSILEVVTLAATDEDEPAAAIPAAPHAKAPIPAATRAKAAATERPPVVALTPAPFTVAIEYALTDALRRTLVAELQACAGPVTRALLQALAVPQGRVTFRVEQPT